MRANPPGLFRNGMFGPSGQTNGYGQYWEPDMYPDYDFLDDHPTAADVVALRNHRNNLSTNTYSGFTPLATGGVCSGGKEFLINMFRHKLVFNGRDYWHYALVRHPAYDSTPPVGGEYPIMLVLHGNTGDPIETDKITRWDNVLRYNDFYTDQCVVVLPLFFGYEFQLPGDGDYLQDCVDALDLVDYDLFAGQHGQSRDPSESFFQTDYLADGLTADDVQIMAILQSLKAVLSEETELDISLNGEVGIIGESLGTGMLYKVAPIIHANGAPGTTLKACIALSGGTDQYAAFNVRRVKRWLGSGLTKIVEDPVYDWIHVTERTYSDIYKNQKNRTKSPGVVEYLKGADPSHVLPENLKRDLRYWYLEDSVARYFQYGSGPYPLQIHHGMMDTTVPVENSRWFADYMRYQEVPFDDDNFEYFESPNGSHNKGTLSAASRQVMADLLSDTMGY